MEMRQWLEQGVMFCILAATGVALWKITVWVAANVVMPATQAHIGFLKTVSESIKAQTVLLEHIGEQLESLHSVIAAQKGVCDGWHERLYGKDAGGKK